MLRALLELSRVSNLPTVWTNVLAAWIIASGSDWRWTPALGWLLLGASLIYSAGMMLNDACDAAWDRNHRPERPIPSGRISHRMVWIIGLTWLLGGAAIMILLGGASWLMTLLLLAAIVAYDVYHKPWAGSVIVMGACRTLLYLAAGSAAVLPTLKSGGLFPVGAYGIILGIYIIALTRTARAEATGNVEGWNRWGLTLLLFLPVVPVFLRLRELPSAEANSLFILPVFVGPVAYALARMKQGGKAIGEAVGWMLATIPAVDALAIAPLSLEFAVGFALIVPLLRLWQRWVAAT